MCLHGGIAKDMQEMKDLDQLNDQIRKPFEIPHHGIEAEIVWNDPCEDCIAEKWGENERGCGRTFSRNILRNLLSKHNLDLVVRSHQVMEDGYGFFGKAKQLITIFSAKNYGGKKFDNDAAILSVDNDLVCKVIRF